MVLHSEMHFSMPRRSPPPPYGLYLTVAAAVVKSAYDYYEQKKILHEYSEMKDDKPTADETPTSDGRSDDVPREADKNKRRRNPKGIVIRRKGHRPHATISKNINGIGGPNKGSASRSSHESDSEETSDDAEARSSIVRSESGKGVPSQDPMSMKAMDKNSEDEDSEDEDNSYEDYEGEVMKT